MSHLPPDAAEQCVAAFKPLADAAKQILASKIDDGGPAMPVPMIPCDNTGGYTEVRHEGMTLRDYFAAEAMQAMVSWSDAEGDSYRPSNEPSDFAPVENPQPGYHWYRLKDTQTFVCLKLGHTSAAYEQVPHRKLTTYEQDLARDAYKQADAMLAERAKKCGAS